MHIKALAGAGSHVGTALGSAAVLTLHGPGRRLIVTAPEEVAAHKHPLGPCLAPAVRDAVDAIVTHRLVLGGRVR